MRGALLSGLLFTNLLNIYPEYESGAFTEEVSDKRD